MFPFKRLRNPYTGRLSAGYRFRLNIRALYHKAIYLPLEMKELPQIKQLMQGVSPLVVFDCVLMKSARKAFDELRKKYDFPFWAVSEYSVQDIDDPDRIVPLWLNSFQHRIADTFIKRYFNRELGRYVISKSFGKVGVTTCVQAYILWRQIYHFRKHSYTCSASDISLNPIKTNLCRFMHRDVVPADKYLYLPKADRRAFFNTFRHPDYIRGIDLGYVHFADMSRWHDSDGDNSSRAYAAAASSVLLKYYSLVVLEGNVPKKNKFDVSKHTNFHIPRTLRLMRLAPLTRNPLFLDYVAMANLPHIQNPYVHIDLG